MNDAQPSAWQRMFPWLRRKHKAPKDDILDRYIVKVKANGYVRVTAYQKLENGSQGKRVASKLLDFSWPWWIRFWTRVMLQEYENDQKKNAKRQERVRKAGLDFE